MVAFWGLGAGTGYLIRESSARFEIADAIRQRDQCYGEWNTEKYGHPWHALSNEPTISR